MVTIQGATIKTVRSANIEEDFIDLIGLVDRRTWFDEWDFLMRI